MPVRNSEIADLFDELADLLDIEGANAFRVRAYRNAARTVRSHPQSMADLLAAGEDLSELPGIGKDLAAKIETIVATRKLPLLEEVAARTPRALAELLKIGGLGPKRVKTLYRELEIRSFEDLRQAVLANRIEGLPGFGAKTAALVRERIEGRAADERRIPLADAEAVAESLVAALRHCPGVKEVAIAGSYRRRRETVGDLDILVTATRGSPVIERFAHGEDVAEVLSEGETRSTVRLRSGLQVDLRVVPQAAYGAALQYFTGSKAHNIAVRKIAARKGLKINEYGVFRGNKRVAGKTESEVYRKIGLPVVPPELREDRGEIEAARSKTLPCLVDIAAIRGDLHCHTDASDGRDSLETLAEAAAARGYAYLAISDYTRRVANAHGLDEKRLCAQLDAIDALNERLDGLVLLKSAEVDILEDGTLGLSHRLLEKLDFTVSAVHTGLELSRKRQTERVLRAMDNPHFTILAHPTGRLIDERPLYEIDLERLMRGAKERGCYLELNANPRRLHLTDEACRLAKDLGIKVAVSTDAHGAADLDFMRFGVDQARRGWLTADDVLNTRNRKSLAKLLAKR
jgi:DNA polymerase (family 10)